jgi:hypothetical protein
MAANVAAALAAWRHACRTHPGNVSMLYVAGHGLQTSLEGGIVLLADVGAPTGLSPLAHAIDVGSVRRGMVSDPSRADSATPGVQYYFFDACRVQPAAAVAYTSLTAGLVFDEPNGLAPTSSYVMWASRSRDFALADRDTRTTLFSAAFTEVLDRRAVTDADGRTVRLADFAAALEDVVQELAEAHDEEQHVIPSGAGSMRTPVHRRPAAPGAAERAVRPLSSLRPVRVNTGPESVTFTIVDADGAVAAEGRSGDTVDVFPGDYTVALAGPWGQRLEAAITVEDAPVDVDVAVPAPDPRRLDGSRLRASLGPGGHPGEWFLRFLAAGPEGLVATREGAPWVEVDDVDEDRVAMVLHASGPDLRYAEVRSIDGRVLIVGLPAVQRDGGPTSCWLHLRANARTLGAVVRSTDPDLDSAMGLMTVGRYDEVLDRTWRQPTDSALATVLAGYAAQRVGPEAPSLEPLAGVLSAATEWLPDAAVLLAAEAARAGRPDDAQQWERRALDLGLPLFTAGLSHLSPWAATARYDAVVTTLGWTIGPEIDGTAGLEPGTGWRRFVRASLPRDPRDYWEEL